MLLWGAFVDEAQLPVLRALAEAGWEGVEVPVAGGDDDEHYARLGRHLRELGLEPVAVGFVTADEDPLSPDALTRDRAVARIRQLAERADRLGARRMVGPMQEAYAHFPGPPTDEERARSAEVLRRAADAVAPLDLELCIEPLNRFECRLANTLEQAAALVRAADRPNLGVLFDTHHAHIEADDPVASVRATADVLRHVQLSENHRGVPGTGQVDFASIAAALRAADYDDWLVVEAFSRIDPAWGDVVRIWDDRASDWQDVSQKGLALISSIWA